MSKGHWRRPPSKEVLEAEKEARIKEFLEMDKEALEEKNERQIDIEKGIPQSLVDEYEATLKPLGHFNIPDLLDKRRLEFGIPNEVFEGQPIFDRVYIFQISDAHAQETYVKGGTILMSDHAIKARKEITPRGVLVSAGLKALDALRSNGVEIGHIVRFQKLAPFVMYYNTCLPVPMSVTVVRDGDVIESEDLGKAIYTDRTTVVANISKDSYDHRYRFKNKQSYLEVTGKKVDEYYDPSY
jgi:hypothetical protein